jgi:hypothetical protein
MTLIVSKLTPPEAMVATKRRFHRPASSSFRVEASSRNGTSGPRRSVLVPELLADTVCKSSWTVPDSRHHLERCFQQVVTHGRSICIRAGWAMGFIPRG